MTKITQISLVLAAMVLPIVATSKNLVNKRMLGEDAKRLFNGRVWRHGGNEADPHGSKRALKGEPQERSFDEFGFAEERSDGLHYQAMSLDYFRKGMDPEFFEWVNPGEIAAGESTCGFMKPSLGSRLDESYPAIEVYVCAKFAKTQPAPKGNIFAHCGGPVALTGCAVDMPEQETDFNIWTIDQRGMGRSSPNFVIPECSVGTGVRDDSGTLTSWDAPADPPPDDKDAVMAYLEAYKQRSIGCWSVPEFKLEAEQEDGTTKSYHFLEFAGTRQLAEDIERMRLLMDAPYMHVKGVSYGTTVMATYATMFPESTGLFVIDSCESPILTHKYQAESAGIGAEQRFEYTYFSCEAKNLESPGSCPVEDIKKCLDDLSAVATQPKLNPISMDMVLMVTPGRAQEFCDVAADGNAEELQDLYAELVPTAVVASKRQALSPSQPSGDMGPIYGNPDYSILVYSFVTSHVIKHIDHTEPFYNPERFFKEVQAFRELYSKMATNLFVSEYAIGYYVMKAAPMPVLGNPDVKGIITGALYDNATPYRWTQELKDRFRNTKLITSQGTEHGAISFAYPDCAKLTDHYWATGEMTFTDGYICGADYPTLKEGFNLH